MEAAPTTALKISSLLFFPIIGILFFNKNPNVKKREPNDRKNTI
jgi:hypothetical protein